VTVKRLGEMSELSTTVKRCTPGFVRRFLVDELSNKLANRLIVIDDNDHLLYHLSGCFRWWERRSHCSSFTPMLQYK